MISRRWAPVPLLIGCCYMTMGQGIDLGGLSLPSYRMLLIVGDNDASRQVRDGLTEELKERVRIVTGDYDANELKGIIGQCDFFIGSRMHSCIAALSQGVPCVGVAYSMKFRGGESVGMQDWVVDGRAVAEDEAARRVMDLYRKRDQVRGALAERAEAARVRLKEVFEEILHSAVQEC